MGAKKGRIEELPGARGARVSTQRSTLAREGKPNDYRDRVTLLPPRVSEQRLLGFQTGGSSPEKRLGLARCERDRSAGAEQAASPCSICTTTCCCRSRCMQARRCRVRRESRQSRGADPIVRGCKSTLTCRGFAVAFPCHWHCSRRGQGRQLRMLAAYTTRKLPSASRRRSCADSFCPARQRNVPSG